MPQPEKPAMAARCAPLRPRRAMLGYPGLHRPPLPCCCCRSMPVQDASRARGEPAPDPFLKAAERLGVEPPLCLALEDSHNGVRSASSAGMITIMVPDLSNQR